MQHTLSVMVENRAGVLSRVSGLFGRRGYNIESLAVGTTEIPEISRMTIVVNGDDAVIEQVTKQLHKLVEVIKITDITHEPHVDRELVLIKVAAGAVQRSEVMQVADIFRVRIVDVGMHSLTIEATGDAEKLAAIEASLRPFGIQEIARTGKIAMTRAPKSKSA